MSEAHTPTTARILTLGEPQGQDEERSALAVFWRRFSAHRMATVGLLMMSAIVLYILIGSFVFSEEYANDLNLRQKWEAPSAKHPFGTDEVGRDVMARTVYGGQISLAISVLSVAVTTITGTTLGLIAGYYGGWLDNIIMRVAEALLSIPLLFLLLVLSKFIGTQMPEVNVLGREISGSVVVIILVLGLTTWMGLSRIVRSLVLSLKEREFIIAARHRHEQPPHRLPAHPAERHGPGDRGDHIGNFAGHLDRSECQLSGFGRAATHGQLGQYDPTGDGADRHRAMVMVLPWGAHFVIRAERQFHRRRLARRAGSL